MRNGDVSYYVSRMQTVLDRTCQGLEIGDSGLGWTMSSCPPSHAKRRLDVGPHDYHKCGHSYQHSGNGSMSDASLHPHITPKDFVEVMLSQNDSVRLLRCFEESVCIPIRVAVTRHRDRRAVLA